MIHQVALISLGDAKGHFDSNGQQVVVDQTTLEQVFNFCKKVGSIKLKADHRSGVMQTIGFVRGFSLSESKVLGDVYIYETEEERPKIFEIAAKNPSHMGISLEFSGADQSDGENCLARCSEVTAAALVSDPAANSSLFSIDKSKNIEKPAVINTMSKKNFDEVKPEDTKPDGETEEQKPITLEELSKKFDDFSAKFSKMFAEEDAKPADEKKDEPAVKDDTKLEEGKEPDGDEGKDEEFKKLEKAAEMGAQRAVKEFAAKIGVNLKPAGNSESKTTAKTFDQLVETETKRFDGDKQKAMLHCLSVYKAEYAASRNVQK